MIIHDTIPYNYLPQIEYNSIEEQNRAKKCHHFPSVKMSNLQLKIRKNYRELAPLLPFK